MARQSRNSWTSYSTATLVDLASKGFTRREIAVRLQRSPKAVERKMHTIKYAFVRSVSFGQFALMMNR